MAGPIAVKYYVGWSGGVTPGLLADVPLGRELPPVAAQYSY